MSAAACMHAEVVTKSLGEGLTRRKRPRDASMGGSIVAGDVAVSGAGEPGRAAVTEDAAKFAPAAAAAKPAADLPGADLPPVLAPPGRCDAQALSKAVFGWVSVAVLAACDACPSGINRQAGPPPHCCSMVQRQPHIWQGELDAAEAGTRAGSAAAACHFRLQQQATPLQVWHLLAQYDPHRHCACCLVCAVSTGLCSWQVTGSSTGPHGIHWPASLHACGRLRATGSLRLHTSSPS